MEVLGHTLDKTRCLTRVHASLCSIVSVTVLCELAILNQRLFHFFSFVCKRQGKTSRGVDLPDSITGFGTERSGTLCAGGSIFVAAVPVDFIDACDALLEDVSAQLSDLSDLGIELLARRGGEAQGGEVWQHRGLHRGRARICEEQRRCM